MAGPHVVLAELAPPAERRQAFRALALDFARDCQRLEPGCRQFQVIAMAEEASTLLFIEVYDSAEAFEVHRRSAHLARFQQAFSTWQVAERPLRQGLLLERRP